MATGAETLSGGWWLVHQACEWYRSVGEGRRRARNAMARREKGLNPHLKSQQCREAPAPPQPERVFTDFGRMSRGCACASI
jgi:hypothetical protein